MTFPSEKTRAGAFSGAPLKMFSYGHWEQNKLETTKGKAGPM